MNWTFGTPQSVCTAERDVTHTVLSSAVRLNVLLGELILTAIEAASK